MEKTFDDKTPVTTVRMSEQGRRTLTEHWEELQRLRDEADRWTAAPNDE